MRFDPKTEETKLIPVGGDPGWAKKRQNSIAPVCVERLKSIYIFGGDWGGYVNSIWSINLDLIDPNNIFLFKPVCILILSFSADFFTIYCETYGKSHYCLTEWFASYKVKHPEKAVISYQQLYPYCFGVKIVMNTTKIGQVCNEFY